jgi:hypothetical protein
MDMMKYLKRLVEIQETLLVDLLLVLEPNEIK